MKDLKCMKGLATSAANGPNPPKCCSPIQACPYFAHHLFTAGLDRMLEVDIYVSIRLE